MDPTTQSTMLAGGIGIGIAYALLIIISLVCWIKVLIALFNKEGAGMGILGILCSIYAFIWGWIKSTELGLKKTMIWWTICIVGFMALGVVASGALANNPEFQRQFREAQRKAQEQQAAPEPATQQ